MPRRSPEVVQALDGDADTRPQPGDTNADRRQDEQRRTREDRQQAEQQDPGDDREIVQQDVPQVPRTVDAAFDLEEVYQFVHEDSSRRGERCSNLGARSAAAQREDAWILQASEVPLAVGDNCLITSDPILRIFSALRLTMPDRRSFLKTSVLGAAAAPILLDGCSPDGDTGQSSRSSTDPAAEVRPIALSTWDHGLAANDAAWPILTGGGSALDAVETGVRIPEADPSVTSVGYGGRPDRFGRVTLDACIMDERGRCGSVAFLQHIMHPISVARQVMEKTPHVMIVGQGALDFALANGFEREDLLHPDAAAAWEQWKEENGEVQPQIDVHNHDTIGMLAIDQAGNLSGACTTSGAAFKYHGRVGDSPIIGAGLYVDNEVGGATATGWGEAVIRAVGCFLVVELMRQGHTPQEACELAVERVIEKNPDWRSIQVGFLALGKNGDHGSFCIAPGFNYAIYSPEEGNQLIDSGSRI